MNPPEVHSDRLRSRHSLALPAERQRGCLNDPEFSGVVRGVYMEAVIVIGAKAFHPLDRLRVRRSPATDVIKDAAAA